MTRNGCLCGTSSRHCSNLRYYCGVLGAISSAGMMMGLFGGMDNESDDMYDSSSEIEERYDTYENGSERRF